MKWTILIDQRAAINLGLDLDVKDLAICDFVKDWLSSPKSEKIVDEDATWIWMGHKLLLDQLPILKLKSKDSVYRRLVKLVNMGILEQHPRNKEMNRSYYKPGKMFHALLFDEEVTIPKEVQTGMFVDEQEKTSNFRNSAVHDIEVFKSHFTKEEQDVIDIEYYHGAVERWSDTKKVRRTARGWIATAKNFMDRNNKEGKLKTRIQADPNSIIDYLKT